MQNQQTKYYALQILEQVIKTRWKILPRNQCEGIKKYIVGLIIKTSSDSETLENSKVYLNKLNMILVQVLDFATIFSLNLPSFTSTKHFFVLFCLLPGSQTRMAEKLGVLHRRHCRRE